MFERSLIVSAGSRASKELGWTTVASITLQVALAGLIVGLPLLHPEVMTVRTHAPMAFLPAPKLPQIKPVQVVHAASAANQAANMSTPAPSVALTAPRVIPSTISMKPDDGPSQMPVKFGDGGMGGTDPLAVLSNVPARVVSVAPAPQPKRVNVSSGVSAGMLISPIQPIYPTIAKAAHVQGTVVVEAIISKSGLIESLHVVSGPEMLRASAMEAIRVARYHPYKLNGEPTEVQTTFTVNFTLGS